MLKAIGAFLAVLAVAALPAQGAAERLVRFQTPSRNIGCLYAPRQGTQRTYLRCDILSGLRPEPKRACELDWTGYSAGARGRATPTCAGDTVFERRAPVLAYGRTWKGGPFTCTSRRTGLRCTNAAGHGFVLARVRSSMF